MMTLRNIRQIMMTACCTILIGGCSETESIINQESGIPITFTTEDNYGDSRNTLVNEFVDGNNIVVDAFYKEDPSADSGIEFMKDQMMTKSGNDWNYDPIKYWPMNGVIDFYGYYPERFGTVNVDENNGNVILAYDIDDATKDNLYAYVNPMDKTEGKNGVLLNFKHAFANVLFTVTDVAKLNNHRVKVKDFVYRVFTNTEANINLTLLANDPNLANDSELDDKPELAKMFKYHTGQTKDFDTELIIEEDESFAYKSSVFLIPGTLINGEVDLTIEMEEQNGGDWVTVSSITEKLYLKNIRAIAGNRITYNINYTYKKNDSGKITITVTIEGDEDKWENVDNTNNV